MRIVFMGTSQFACPAFFEILKSDKHQIIAVYTKEPQMAGRGQKIQISPIHDAAQCHNLPVYTPKTLNDPIILRQFQSHEADITIVISYGMLLPKQILESPKFGCFNLHPSALPLWRGAAPIQRSIIAGDNSTAVCVIKMDEGLDSGDIAKDETINLQGNETCDDLFKMTADIGARLIIELLSDLESGKVSLRKQNHLLATYAKKIDKSECLIDWNRSVIEIERKIRGLSGSLGANFLYSGEKIKILAAEFIEEKSLPSSSIEAKAGQVLDKNFKILCKDGVLLPKIIQRQGKKAMPIAEFLRGFVVEIGKIL